jgi:nitrate reductase gamma subunit
MHTGFYLAAGAVIAVFIIASHMKIKIWLSGADDEDAPELVGATPFKIMIMSIQKLLSPECLFAYRVGSRSSIRQWALNLTMWSFYLLVLGTATVALDYDFFYGAILHGHVWKLFSLVLDVAGLILFVAVTFFLLRRFVFPPERIVGNLEDAIIMILLLLVVVSAYAVEGTRLAIQNFPPHWSPVGRVSGLLINAIFFKSASAMKLFYPLAWSVHVALSFAFILYIPFSKQFHMFATQITTANVAVRETYRKGLMYRD